MSSNHTEHYNLSQWEKSDRVLMEDFNADNAKIDAVLAELQAGQLRLHSGTYTGDGMDTLTLEFPFPPKAIWIQKMDQWDEHMIIFGNNKVHFQVGDAYGEQLPWCTSGGTDMRISGNILTFDSTHYTGLTDKEKSMYCMNRRPYTYMYLVIG